MIVAAPSARPIGRRPAPGSAVRPRIVPAAARRPLIAGNWKQNPATAEAAESLAQLVAAAARTFARDRSDLASGVEIAVAPPAPYLSLVHNAVRWTQVQVAAQNCHWEETGAFTGEVGPGMLKSLGVDLVILGHSERRMLFGETDAEVNRKLRAALAKGLRVILCVGESKEEYEAQLAKHVCCMQLAKGLAGVSPEEMDRVVIAYEPVWAIGTGLSATPEIAQAVHADIRAWLADTYGREVADRVIVQYGGSVTPETVDDLIRCPDVDGFLVGGASLAADKFARIFSFTPPGTPPRGPTVAPRVVKAERALATKNVLGESAVWDAERNELFWIDIQGKELWRWAPESFEDPKCVPLAETPGFVALHRDGALVLGLDQSGIVRYDPDSGATSTVVAGADFEAGLDTRPNDTRADRHGNLVVGSYNNAHRTNARALAGLYRLTPQGRLEEILSHRYRVSNAICFAPHGGEMYFCDSPTRRVWAYQYAPAGPLGPRRLVYEMGPELAGVPDGAQVDADGFVWVTLSGAAQVVRLCPRTGDIDAVVELPVSSPTSVTFGGPGLATMYITTRGPDGGALYRATIPGVRGVAEPTYGAAESKAVVGGDPGGNAGPTIVQQEPVSQMNGGPTVL
ncbi:unnamed protein product [Pedinophyceae sp. YPF-701]|nr:unnamed protein product [Pedinophyceae sp. YPF-701]